MIMGAFAASNCFFKVATDDQSSGDVPQQQSPLIPVCPIS
jgi:hypothetical protein